MYRVDTWKSYFLKIKTKNYVNPLIVYIFSQTFFKIQDMFIENRKNKKKTPPPVKQPPGSSLLESR
jgi:hypothetical protein